ncbi:fructose 2,6-bisphosphatase [Pseudohongiella nitratireducens]|uniref:Fructose 2,6-bisphosphatase n=1 Tax=Pseudohongiella nitratireducens TaxID=1768907 RepID=A0A916QLY9_9GAMM|nr:histidine phosphatase family protein [Pseudohongiella nitratireducens]GFZ78534.1 fructose 2,6-bisphosphatase [Pseudohongiella nitratireducens]|tara:strand:+ start:30954 stop:31664 length:711 start_codon:yes stop_codon:yes gene_type:complete
MGQLYLVRHGQASFGKANYDELSRLGEQQAYWLGEYFQSLSLNFDRVVTGTLQRQQDTAKHLLRGARQDLPVSTDPGFNEFDFKTVASVYCHAAGIELPSTRHGGKLFFQMLRQAILAWSAGELHASAEDTASCFARQQGLETWPDFNQRVADAMNTIIANEAHENVLVVSSGGAMALAVSQILGCDVEKMIDLNMQTRNTGYHQLFFNQRGYQLSSFNALPHLMREDRLAHLSYT